MIDVQKLARESGMKASIGKIKDGKYKPDVNALFSSVPIEWLERFSALVLEEAAKACDDLDAYNEYDPMSTCVAAIRSLKPKGEA